MPCAPDSFEHRRAFLRSGSFRFSRAIHAEFRVQLCQPGAFLLELLFLWKGLAQFLLCSGLLIVQILQLGIGGLYAGGNLTQCIVQTCEIAADIGSQRDCVAELTVQNCQKGILKWS